MGVPNIRVVHGAQTSRQAGNSLASLIYYRDMKPQIFINLPVQDLQKSIDFFTKLGFTFNPQFTDETATCMIINDGASYAMLLTVPKFQQFIPGKDVIDAKKHTEVLTALSFESREAVDAMADKAVAAGGRDYRREDLGFMYTRVIEDLDGHLWELFHMDMSQMPQT